jgi:hypothetical protein
MKKIAYSTSFIVDATPEQVFDCLTEVTKWWTENLEGSSKKLEEEFEVQFGDVHYSKQRVVEWLPGKRLVWLVTESRLNFTKDPEEWTGTRIIFEVERKGDRTEMLFTHEGLSPELECFNACSNAWSEYIHQSLYHLIAHGVGKPTRKAEKEVQA